MKASGHRSCDTEAEDATVEDPYDLERFVTAQNAGGTYRRALTELREGSKNSHWMWFVFPQIAGLGHSAMSRKYAVSALAEARDYLRHPVLGPRLIVAAESVAGLQGLTAEQIFGSIDARKLHSSMTLFLRAARRRRCSSRSWPSTSTACQMRPRTGSSATRTDRARLR
jgi:uncharacterized protein (DUF1810 family)